MFIGLPDWVTLLFLAKVRFVLFYVLSTAFVSATGSLQEKSPPLHYWGVVLVPWEGPVTYPKYSGQKKTKL